jgi:hypothetical protein
LSRWAAALLIGRAVGWWLTRRDDRATARRRHDSELCARADRQHAAMLAGDELAGVYGEYPPAA